MNRAAVVFIALAILLAHTLAIHQTPDGDFAAPYDGAHVAYRLGRNLVHEGRALWDPQGGWVESYPSPVWIALAAVAERFYVPPTLVAQWLGILCVLLTVIFMAQFSPTRLAGLIAPTLLAASGSAAAAAASGTEAGLAMLLATVAFLAFERGWKRTLVLSLTVLGLTRPEGVAFLAAIIVLECVARPRDRTGARRASFLRPLLIVPIIPVALTMALRLAATGNWLSPFAAETLRFDPARWDLGAHYLWSFVIASGSGALVFLPILFVLGRRLSPTGTRALVLFLVWAGVVGLSGGSEMPFWNALAPSLPLLFVAIQAAVTAWMDRRPRQAPLAWALLALAVTASFLVSRHPGDVGPLPLERLQRAWMEPSRTLLEAYDERLGRMGLLNEIRQVERLRPLGLFLRDEIGADATVATLWPGAIGYLSRKRVFDLLGRTQPLLGEGRSHSWRGVPRTDFIAALGSGADYLVPLIGTLAERGATAGLMKGWLERYDTVGPTDDRMNELLAVLRRYELVAVPVMEKSYEPNVPSKVPFLVLRRRDLGQTPEIQVVREGDEVEVTLSHKGHRQVVDLALSVIESSGVTWSMRPTGEWVQVEEVRARTDILIYDTGPRRIRLLRTHLPDVPAVWLSARLFNAGVEFDSPLAPIGAPVLLKLR